MGLDYPKLVQIARIFQIATAIILVLLFIFRIVIIRYASSLVVWITSFYYLPIAAVIVLVELNVKFIRDRFYFMTFMWGKGLLNLFLGCIGITGYYALEIPIALFFFLSAGVYFILHFVYNHDERKHLEQAGKTDQ